jgi:hypothetical protein
MSLETEISQLTKAINELNAKFELLFNSQKTTPTPPPTQAQEVPTQAQEVPTQAQEVPTQAQPELIPAIAKDVFSREELQKLCLDVIRRNEANRAIVKAIMLQHFDARKTSDLADNQIGLCYNLIKEATHDA